MSNIQIDPFASAEKASKVSPELKKSDSLYHKGTKTTGLRDQMDAIVRHKKLKH